MRGLVVPPAREIVIGRRRAFARVHVSELTGAAHVAAIGSLLIFADGTLVVARDTESAGVGVADEAVVICLAPP